MTIPRRFAALVALACALVLFVALNMLADRTLRGVRIDLTREKLFTLSPGSKATLASIDEPLTLRFYFSRRLGDEVPAYGLYAQRVREMLEEYAALAGGKIRLEMADPVPYSAVEDRAVAFGLQGVPLDQAGTNVYFGLAATNSTDDQQVIPFFQPDRERFLEYDLTKLVGSLARPKKTVVDLVSSLPVEGDVMAAMQGRPMQPFAFIEQLRGLVELRTVGGELDRIDSDVDVLLLIHPQKLPPKTLFAIDQFVLRGGKLLVFVDPNSEVQQSRPSQLNPPGSPTSSDLEPLFKAWGLRLVPDVVAGDRLAARKVNAGGAARLQPVDYVAWLNLKKDALNQNDPITADLGQINMATAGVLEALPGAKTKLEPLIQTSVASMQIPAEKFRGMPDPQALLQGFKRDNRRLVLAARVTGDAETAFPEGPPRDEKAKDEKAQDGQPASSEAKKDDGKPPAEILKASKTPINVVVVADTDMLDDRFWVQASDFFGQRVLVPAANNGDFVANAVEVLAGGNNLIGLRSRGTSARPFELVQDIQRQADERYSAEAASLQEKLKGAEAKIKDLRTDKSGNVVLTSEQSRTIDQLKAEILDTRRKLREVQLSQNQEIDRLKLRLQVFDIAAVPVVVAIVALVLSAVRAARRTRRRRAAA